MVYNLSSVFLYFPCLWVGPSTDFSRLKVKTLLSLHCEHVQYGVRLYDSWSKLHGISSYNRLESLCVGFRDCTSCDRLVQWRDRSTALVLHVSHWGFVHVSCDSNVSVKRPTECIPAIAQYLLSDTRAHNIQTVLIARFIQGAFGSTWATMVGGTIADIWQSHEYVFPLPVVVVFWIISSLKRRGLPMSFFAVAAIGGTGFGPVYAGWVEMNPRLEWRWIQWIQMMCVNLSILSAGWLTLTFFVSFT